MVTTQATLRASLEAHNHTFESLLTLIPAKYYFVQNSDEQASKYLKHSKNQKAPKQAIKEATKKGKREKLDPTNNENIIDIQRKANDFVSSEEDDSFMEVDGDLDHEVEGVGEGLEVMPMPTSGGITQLKEKLHAKILELRQRGRPRESADGGRDELLEERRAQRAAMRERRRKETKEKIRREEESKGRKGKGKEQPTPKEKRDKGHLTKTQLLVPDHKGPTESFATVTFSSLAGASTSTKKVQHLKLTTNPQQALAQLTARKERLAGIPEEQRRDIMEKDQWATAEARMEGIKVHDDEQRLKKAAKRKEKGKEKSKKEWIARKDQITQAMAAKQKKRTDNIAMRNERRNDKRKGVSKAKANIKARPGFEGKTLGRGKGRGK
ncbi:hypothetical protein H0H93_008196 [Arthromyces matolae]|nr:hypothetical protein H0H93_008196 [Arthromyces matolae]